jgi:hypothetical protein
VRNSVPDSARSGVSVIPLLGIFHAQRKVTSYQPD